MSGICGVIDAEGKRIYRELLEKMIASLKHRGPDDEGIYIKNSPDVSIGLVHTRLKVIDLSSAGHQPMFNEDRTVCIVCNGEIYNFKELRGILESKGHRFRSNTDTEVILHLYEEYNEDCLEYLRGMFAFAIWDSRRERLFIARDRMGVKPLYYAPHGSKFLFASEIRGILQDREMPREIDFQSLNDFFTYLYIPPPKTIFKGIYKLPAASYILWENGKIKVNRYWAIHTSIKSNIEPDSQRTEEYYKEELLDLLQETIRLHLIGDVPLGVFLSGGMDSSAILALMAQATNEPIKTFSIGFGKKERLFNEIPYAREVANHFGTEHHEFIVTPDLVKLLPEIIKHFDEPFGNPSSLLIYILSEASKNYITVALSGEGGDEIFIGYPRYQGLYLSEFYKKIPTSIRNYIEKLVLLLPESTKGREYLRRIREFVVGGNLEPIDMYFMWVAYYNQEMIWALFSDDLKVRIGNYDSSNFQRELFFTNKIPNWIEKASYVDLNSFLPYNNLEQSDKMSMANSLEIRVPFCDHKLVEFVAKIPISLRMRGLTTKYIFKKAMSNLLPDSILTRKKMGFSIPIGLWLQNNLKELTSKVLAKEKIKKQGFFNIDYINKLLSFHYSGKRDYSLHIWALLFFELWYQMYIEEKMDLS